jgi:hypothetical protein
MQSPLPQQVPARVLALDVSTKTGWATFIDGRLADYGTEFPDKKVGDFGSYPMNYVRLAEHLVDSLAKKVLERFAAPGTEVVIEETNASRQNYSQKILEYLHFCLNRRLHGYGLKVSYVRTGEWRRAIGATQNAEERKLNAKIRRIKQKTGSKLAKIEGKVVGRRTQKHYALRAVNELFGIELPRKMEDAGEAILLGAAYLKGVPLCDGTARSKKTEEAAA